MISLITFRCHIFPSSTNVISGRSLVLWSCAYYKNDVNKWRLVMFYEHEASNLYWTNFSSWLFSFVCDTLPSITQYMMSGKRHQAILSTKIRQRLSDDACLYKAMMIVVMGSFHVAKYFLKHRVQVELRTLHVRKRSINTGVNHHLV